MQFASKGLALSTKDKIIYYLFNKNFVQNKCRMSLDLDQAANSETLKEKDIVLIKGKNL